MKRVLLTTIAVNGNGFGTNGNGNGFRGNGNGPGAGRGLGNGFFGAWMFHRQRRVTVAAKALDRHFPGDRHVRSLFLPEIEECTPCLTFDPK